MLHKEKPARTAVTIAPTVPVDIDEVTMMQLSQPQPVAATPARRPQKRPLIDIVNRSDNAFYAQVKVPKQASKSSGSLPRIRRYRKLGGGVS